ncbi:MAG: ATPase [Deltaproteobacteria bacterium]|nr:ATPase [Deltaproteobacteria bacterium]
MNFSNKILKLHPAALVLLSFLLAIAIGGLLLKLPFSVKTGSISWVDAFFTSTSAVCVTGLVVVDTGSFFTIFGQCVILSLIQIGGLGVMTVSVLLFRWLGKSVSFRQRMAMQDIFAHTPRKDIFSLIKSTLFFTVIAEVSGALLLTLHWSQELPFINALYTSIFHSVSAFCNAGFALFPNSMTQYSNSLMLNVVMCMLIISGGIGFPVLYDLQLWFRRKKNQRKKLSVQTKTVIVTTVLLISAGAILFFFLEHELLKDTHSFSHRVMISIFQSVTCRTAGFNSVDISALRECTLILVIFLMFVGASPGSCGGGVKTTTLALLGAFTFHRIRGNSHVNMFRKSIPFDAVNRSIFLIFISISVIGIVLFFLLIGEAPAPGQLSGYRGSFLSYLFETVSAFGTVGLSMGATSALGTWGKTWIIFMMVVGRVGVLTFSYIFIGKEYSNGIEYSEENIMIG